MTPIEQRAATSLTCVRYAPETWHEKRARELFRVYHRDPLARLSTNEQADLWFLVWNYRRQVRDVEVVAHADELVNGALSLRF